MCVGRNRCRRPITVIARWPVPSADMNITHVMPWFGTQGHIKMNYTLLDGQTIPYISSDNRITDDQCQRMVLKGVTGINVDWYGPNNTPLQLATSRLLASCERNALSFSICVDKGAIGSLTGTAANNAYISALNFALDAFAASSFYLKDASGKPIFTFFGEPSGVNWTTIRQGLLYPVTFLFEGNFSHAEADGAFGWVNPVTGDPTSINLPALNSFIAAAAANPTKIAWYPVFKGFDDTLASWGQKRVMSAALGRTLSQTQGLVPANATQLWVTWNDHEENSSGTAFEDCASLA